MNTDISLSLSAEATARLRADFDAFVKVSTGLDAQFIPPAFDDFLRARLMQQDGPLTERAVMRLLASGEYGWAKKVFDKQLPNALAALMRDAQRFGFGLAVQPDWTPQQRVEHARQWATHILSEAGADAAFTEALAAQISASAVDIRTLEERMKTPAWRIADGLRQRAYDVMYAIADRAERSAGAQQGWRVARLLGLALEYGSMSAEEAARVLEQVERACPHLFREAPDDVFARLAAWLRRVFSQGALVRQ
jgi:hypothetical protein